MEWTEESESGLPEIDIQHRHIFTLISRVNEIDEQNSGAEIRKVIDEVERYTRKHFEREDSLMATYQYPESTRHKADHEALLLELQRYKNNKIFNSTQLTRILSNWLVSHTLMEDRPLARHVLQCRADSATVGS
jgi:hemerythrin